MPVITVFWRLRQEDYSEHEASISYIAGWGYSVRLSQTKQKNWMGKSITKKNVQVTTDLLILASVCTAVEEMGGAGNTRKRLEDAFLL